MSKGGIPWSGLGIAALVTVLDQIAKWWIIEIVMHSPRVIPVSSFFSIVMAWNRGVSFGLFDSDSIFNKWLLPVVVAVIVVGLVIWLYRTDRILIGAAIGLVIGGAVGNLIDRLRFGAVADFLDFHIGEYHWPAFNLADSAITVGAAVLVLDSLFRPAEKPKNRAREGIDDSP